jgi:hypothetical protein
MEKCSFFGLDTDYMMEDYLGGFSESYFIDVDTDQSGSDISLDGIKTSELLSYIELYNGVSFKHIYSNQKFLIFTIYFFVYANYIILHMQLKFDAILSKFETWDKCALKKKLEDLQTAFLVYFKDGFYYPY